jgi:hypothetical protein
MTQEEAKDYVLTHLPCTMKGIVSLFDLYFHGTVTLEKLVGLQARTLGCAKLVFHLKFQAEVMAEAHPMPQFKHLIKCFQDRARGLRRGGLRQLHRVDQTAC